MEGTTDCDAWLVVGILEIPGVSDVKELAQKIRASFELPRWMSKIHDVTNSYLALWALEYLEEGISTAYGPHIPPP